MNKDQTLGGVIFLVCAIVGLYYVVTLFYPQWLKGLGLQASEASVQFWIIAVPVLVAFVGVICIGAWIGWTMARTPPSMPIDEIIAQPEKESKEPEKESKEPEKT